MSPEELLLAALKQAEHLTYCENCQRIFDARSGCEADIRHDERSRLREKVEAMRDRLDTPGARWPTRSIGIEIPLGPVERYGASIAIDEVLALLAEPGEEQT